MFTISFSMVGLRGYKMGKKYQMLRRILTSDHHFQFMRFMRKQTLKVLQI